MNDLEILGNIGTAAVLELRKRELAAGKSFMINSNDLPSLQCYMEYPDGTINVETVAPGGRSFILLRTLSVAEAQALRQQFNLV